MALTEVVDGTLRYQVKAKDGSASEQNIDVLLLRLHCEECEAAHNLQEVEGRLKPTAAFLADLAGRLKCSPTVAYHLWIASAPALEDLKKNMSETPSSPSGSECPQDQ